MGARKSVWDDIATVIDDVIPWDRQTQVAAPVSFGRTVRMTSPGMRAGAGGITINHCEFITDVVAADELFSCRSFQVNPGVARLFPWLSRIAQNFETYTFNALQFHYVPSCATDNNGNVMLVVDPDATDPVPTDKSEMLQQAGVVQSSIWQRCTHTPRVADLQRIKQRYVRTGAFSGDLKNYDCGQLHLATQGTSDGPLTCGNLFVAYSVNLQTPTPNDNAVSSLWVDSDAPFGQALSDWTMRGDFPLEYRSLGSAAVRFDCEGFLVLTFVGTGTMTGVTVTGVTEVLPREACAGTNYTIYCCWVAMLRHEELTIGFTGTWASTWNSIRFFPCPLKLCPDFPLV
jgi:hypothetical protein